VVQVAWDDMLTVYAIFGGMLLVAIVGLGWLLMRMRIAEAVKLGEALYGILRAGRAIRFLQTHLALNPTEEVTHGRKQAAT